MIIAPSKGNKEIAASGNNMYVTRWTKKTGVVMPLFRARNDGGSTFCKTDNAKQYWVNSHLSSFFFVLKSV
jgi:hypothetical protein